MSGENVSAEVEALMWHSTVAQTTGVALHPPSAAEITCKITSEKCKSAFKLIKCPLDGRCLVKLQNPNAKPGCSLLKTGEIQQQQLLRLQEIKSRSGGVISNSRFVWQAQTKQG